MTAASFTLAVTTLPGLVLMLRRMSWSNVGSERQKC
jgi:hypothetical protein